MRSATAGRLLRGASEKGRLEIRVGGRGASVSPGQKPSCSRKSTDWSPCGRETKFSRCRHSRQCSVQQIALALKGKGPAGRAMLQTVNEIERELAALTAAETKRMAEGRPMSALEAARRIAFVLQSGLPEANEEQQGQAGHERPEPAPRDED